VDDGSQRRTHRRHRAADGGGTSGGRGGSPWSPAVPCPPAWTGKLWAVRQGIAAGHDASRPLADYLLLSDADIVYASDTRDAAGRKGAGRPA